MKVFCSLGKDNVLNFFLWDGCNRQKLMQQQENQRKQQLQPQGQVFWTLLKSGWITSSSLTTCYAQTQDYIKKLWTWRQEGFLDTQDWTEILKVKIPKFLHNINLKLDKSSCVTAVHHVVNGCYSSADLWACCQSKELERFEERTHQYLVT